MGVSEIGRALDLSRSTAHRYVATLAALGYLQQDRESKRYRLGPRVLDLGFSAINSMDVREISAPHLQQLSDETGHTVNMAILDGGDIVYIERCRASRPGQREIDLNLHIGARLPAYCTAMGKAMLAFLPDDRLAADPRRPRAHRARAEHDHRRGRVPGRARAASARRASQSTTRSWPTACARSRRRSARLGRSGGGDQPRSPPLDGPDDRSDRALFARCPQDGGRHLRGDPLTNGRRPPSNNPGTGLCHNGSKEDAFDEVVIAGARRSASTAA